MWYQILPRCLYIPISNRSVHIFIENTRKSCFFQTGIIRASNRSVRKHQEELFLPNGDNTCSSEDESQHNGIRLIIQERLSTHSLLEVILSSSMHSKEECKLTPASMDAILSSV